MKSAALESMADTKYTEHATVNRRSVATLAKSTLNQRYAERALLVRCTAARRADLSNCAPSVHIRTHASGRAAIIGIYIFDALVRK
jgi:hypothetical protein